MTEDATAHAVTPPLDHLLEHCYWQPGDCTAARDLRMLLSQAVHLAREAQAELDAIAALEVHGSEFVDATELYKILGKPIPEPIDHAANLRGRYGA